MCSASKSPIRNAVRDPRRDRRRRCGQVGCPIRKSPDQRSLSPPRSLSQSATSFIASCRQGIHPTPFSRLIASRKTAGARDPFGTPIRAPASGTAFSLRTGPCGGASVRGQFPDLERRDAHPPSPPEGEADGTRPASLSSRCQRTLAIRGGSPKGLTNVVHARPLGAVLVEPAGIEPATLCLQSRCSPS